jgi:glycosyltransferase involved in cell wall biosynthesis
MNVHLYPTNLKNETRILKIVKSLRSNKIFTKIFIVGKGSLGLPEHEDLGNGIHLYRLNPIFGTNLDGLFSKFFSTIGWYISFLIWIFPKRVVCLNCHSLPILPISVFVKIWKRSILIYDTHELETETNVSFGLRKIFMKLVERIFIRWVDEVCVVNKSIGSWYVQAYSLKKTWVVRNVPYRFIGKPQKTGMLRDAIGLTDPNALLFIYQGILAPGRGIDILLEVFSKIKANYHLVFMGYGSMEERIQSQVLQQLNIHFMPAVKPDLIHKYTIDADIGISLMEKTCLSQYYAAPNKLFEYLSCGVPAIVSNFPEMENCVTNYDCGWSVEPSVYELEKLIKAITFEIILSKKENALGAGQDYCWENEEAELIKMYKKYYPIFSKWRKQYELS